MTTPKQHLCADTRGVCVAVVREAGDKCPVHRRALQGPCASPCERCGKPILREHFYVRSTKYRASGEDHPFHYECRPGRSPAEAGFKQKREKKSWDTGLGLVEERR